MAHMSEQKGSGQHETWQGGRGLLGGGARVGLLSLIGVCWLLAVGIARATAAPPVDLGTLGGSFSEARAVNNNGMVVGYSETSGGTGIHAFIWTQIGGMVDLGTLGTSWSNAAAVNHNGIVVGDSAMPGDTSTHAFVWTQSGGMVDLGTLGGSNSQAFAVNDDGMVVGSSYMPGDTSTHAFVWTQAGGMVDLGTLGGNESLANAVNDDGMVVGRSYMPGDTSTHAFVWTQAGGMVDLGTLGGGFTQALAVNNNGMVVGESDMPDGMSRHAFVWTQAGGMVDLGTLGGPASTPFAVNHNGMVVGSSTTPDGGAEHAFVWTQAGGMVDLGTLGGVHNSEATAVNDNGIVVGNSWTLGDAGYHAFLWTQAGGMVDLGTLGGNESLANAVNLNGMVVGSSTLPRDPDSGVVPTHAALWVPEANTPSGDNVALQLGDVALTFASVSAPGDTTATLIDPSTIGDVPSGFAVSELLAYEVTTTAIFTGPVTIGLVVPGPISEAEFNSLIVLHNENGVLVDVTASAPPRDYATLTIYATTTSLSPFYVVRTNQHVVALFDQTKAYKFRSTVPIKLQLLNSANANVSSSSTLLTARSLRRVGSAESVQVVDSGNANPDSNFRYDPTLGGTGGYIFNLSTRGLTGGRHVLSFYAGNSRSFFYTVMFEVK